MTISITNSGSIFTNCMEAVTAANHSLARP